MKKHGHNVSPSRQMTLKRLTILMMANKCKFTAMTQNPSYTLHECLFASDLPS